MGVRAKGGASRGKGSAVGSGLERQWDWKVQGREAVSMFDGCRGFC